MMYTLYRENIIFTNRQFVTIYVKSGFSKNVKFGSVALAFLYGSCFNARWPTMVADIFEDFEPSSKNFLATPLRIMSY